MSIKQRTEPKAYLESEQRKKMETVAVTSFGEEAVNYDEIMLKPIQTAGRTF